MIFTRTFDKEIISHILLDSGILGTTEIDDKSNLEIDAGKNCFLECKIDDQTVGIAVFEPDNSVCVNYHPNLLREYRGKHSIEFTIQALKWVYKNAPMYLKINAKFPAVYKHLKPYAKKCGFTQEGIDLESCKLGDRLCYGITRKEIESL